MALNIRGALRGVSPLIATIILISLTVAIGALIVGWGRQYVKMQTECLGYQIDIMDVKYNSANNALNIVVSNNGMNEISLDPATSRLVFLATIGGNQYTCKVAQTTPTGGCSIQPGATIKPGDIATITVTFATGINLANFESGQFMIQGCGTLGGTITKYMIK